MKPTVEQIMESIAHEAREQNRRAEQQLDPSDCALSSWASGATSRVKEMELKLALCGWMAWFPVLLDARTGQKDARTGQKVNAKQITSKYGRCWMVRPEGRDTGPAVAFVGIGDRAMAAKGYKGGWERSPASARFRSNFVGDCGFVDIVRDSDGMSHGRLERPESEAPKAKRASKAKRRSPSGEEMTVAGDAHVLPPGIRISPKRAPRRCDSCERFFSPFRCGANEGSGECDCPKCQGTCECK